MEKSLSKLFSNFEKQMDEKMKTLNQKFDQRFNLLNIKIEELKVLVTESRALRAQDEILSFEDLVTKHNLSCLPIKKKDEYDDFEILLNSNEELMKDLV